jgi:aspartokinase
MVIAVEKVKIGGMIKKPSLALIGILSGPEHSGLMSAVFEALGERSINCVLIVQSVDTSGQNSIVFAVARARLPRVLEALSEVQGEFEATETLVNRNVGIISVFGPHFGERPGIAGHMLAALWGDGIAVHATSTSISSLSCVVDEDKLEEAVRALRQAFQLPGS